MWVWLKLKLTPKGDFCVVSVSAFFVNFFMHSTKRWTNIVTFHSKHPNWDQNLQFTPPESETTSFPVTFSWESPHGMYHDSLIRDNVAIVIRNLARGMNYGIKVPLLSNPESSSWTPKSTALNPESNQHCLKLPNTRRRLRQLPIKWRK